MAAGTSGPKRRKTEDGSKYCEPEKLEQRCSSRIGASLVEELDLVPVGTGLFNVLDGAPGTGKTTAMMRLALNGGGAVISTVGGQLINTRHCFAGLDAKVKQAAELDVTAGQCTTLQQWIDGGEVLGDRNQLRTLIMSFIDKVQSLLEEALTESQAIQLGPSNVRAGHFYPKRKEDGDARPTICIDEVGSLTQHQIRVLRNAMLGAMVEKACTHWQCVLGGTGALAVNMISGGSSTAGGCNLCFVNPHTIYAPKFLHPIAQLYRRRPRLLQKMAALANGRDDLAKIVQECIDSSSSVDGVPDLQAHAVHMLLTGCTGGGRTPVIGELAGSLISLAAFEPGIIGYVDAGSEGSFRVGLPENALSYTLLRGPITVKMETLAHYNDSGMVRVSCHDPQRSDGDGGARRKAQEMIFRDLLDSHTSLSPDGLTEALFTYTVLSKISQDMFQKARNWCLKHYGKVPDARACLNGDCGEALCAHKLLATSWKTFHCSSGNTVEKFLVDLGADATALGNDSSCKPSIFGMSHAPWLPIHSRAVSEVGVLEISNRRITFPIPPQHTTYTQSAKTTAPKGVFAGHLLANAIVQATNIVSMAFCHHRMHDARSSVDFDILVVPPKEEPYFIIVEVKNALTLTDESLLKATTNKWQAFREHFSKNNGATPVLVCGLTLLPSKTLMEHVDTTPVVVFSIGEKLEAAQLQQQPVWIDRLPEVQTDA